MSSIEVLGTAERSFLFPASRPTAYEFYSSLHRIVPFLPRIVLVAEEDDGLCRVAYRSRELGIYDVDILCDLQLSTAARPDVLHIAPAETNLFPPVTAWATLRSCHGLGRFHISSHFTPLNDHETRIDYQLTLAATLPKPLGLLLVPDQVMRNVVQRIVQMRIEEIADQFIENSVAAFEKQTPL
jgi:hypothetical protein